MIKASKLDILQFIYERGVIGAFDLIEKFGYTEGGAYSRLGYLKSQGLVVNDRKGEWAITDDGLRKLIYHGRI